MIVYVLTYLLDLGGKSNLPWQAVRDSQLFIGVFLKPEQAMGAVEPSRNRNWEITYGNDLNDPIMWKHGEWLVCKLELPS